MSASIVAEGDSSVGHTVGIDVGGTFTDFVAYNPKQKQLDRKSVV